MGETTGSNETRNSRLGSDCEHLEDFVRLLLAADDDAARLAVADLVLDLSRSQRSVQRHVGRARWKGSPGRRSSTRSDFPTECATRSPVSTPSSIKSGCRAVGHPAIVGPGEIVIQAVPLVAHARSAGPDSSHWLRCMSERLEYFIRPHLLRIARCVRNSLASLENRGDPLPLADAHRRQAELRSFVAACGARAWSRSVRRWRPADARARSRRPGGSRALRRVPSSRRHGEHLHGERFVDFDAADVGQRQPGAA